MTEHEMLESLPVGEEDYEQPEEESELLEPEGQKSAEGARELYRLGEYYVPQGAACLGGGRLSKVYLCRKEGSEECFAAKIYPEESAGRRNRQLWEINERIRRLDCPNIVKIYDHGYLGERGLYMLVMKKYEKPRWQEFLPYGRVALSTDEYAERFCDAAEDLNNALRALHQREIDIYHSDIKPENVMMDERGRLVLVDFGGAVQAGLEPDGWRRESARANTKTAHYQPPEALATEYSVCAASDYWGIGIVLAQIFAGDDPHMSEKNAYVYKYLSGGRGIGHYVFPPDTPAYLFRLFQGLLYDNLMDYRQVRWNEKKVSRWIELVREGDYAQAARIPAGAAPEGETKAPERMETARPILVRYQSGVKEIRSEADMAELFVRNWQETIDRLLAKENWPESFQRLGSDLVNLLIDAKEQMQEAPWKCDAILEETIIRIFYPRERAGEQLRYHDHFFEDKRALGRRIFYSLQRWRDRTQGTFELPEYGNEKAAPGDETVWFLEMIASRELSRALCGMTGERWHLEPEELDLLKRAEKALSKGTAKGSPIRRMDLVENLYRLSYRLFGAAIYETGGVRYTRYGKLFARIKELFAEDPSQAIAFAESFRAPDGKLRVDFFAWTQEADGVVNRPGREAREYAG